MCVVVAWQAEKLKKGVNFYQGCKKNRALPQNLVLYRMQVIIGC